MLITSTLELPQKIKGHYNQHLFVSSDRLLTPYTIDTNFLTSSAKIKLSTSCRASACCNSCSTKYWFNCKWYGFISAISCLVVQWLAHVAHNWVLWYSTPQPGGLVSFHIMHGFYLPTREGLHIQAKELWPCCPARMDHNRYFLPTRMKSQHSDFYVYLYKICLSVKDHSTAVVQRWDVQYSPSEFLYEFLSMYLLCMEVMAVMVRKAILKSLFLVVQ